MESADLHASQVGAAGTYLLRRFSGEGDERDLVCLGDSGSYGVAGFFDHGVGLACARAGDDDGAVFLGQDCLALFGIQARKGRIVLAFGDEAPVGSMAMLFVCQAEGPVEA